MRRLLFALLLAGCVPDAQSIDIDDEAGFAAFESSVQPILADRCANPSCHGAVGRPLQLYAAGWHRLDPADLHSMDGLNEEELRLNYSRASGFVQEAAQTGQCHLLTKPLAESAGGAAHGGGAQFEDQAEPDYLTLQGWVGAVLQLEAP